MATGLLQAVRPVACVAATNAAVQGLAGIVLGVLALCVSFCVLGTPVGDQNAGLYQHISSYLQGSACGNNSALYDDITSTDALRIWFGINVCFSGFMLFGSLCLLFAVANRWSDEMFQVTLVSWLFFMTFVSVNDLVIGYVIGHDFTTSLDRSDFKGNMSSVAIGVLFFAVVRGGYLWLMNSILVVYLFVGASALHTFIISQVGQWAIRDDRVKSRIEVEAPVEVEIWPSIESLAGSKRQLTSAQKPTSERLQNGDRLRFTAHSTMPRWPSYTGRSADNIRSVRPELPVNHRLLKARDRQPPRVMEGVQNLALEPDNNRMFLRLHNDVGTSQDFDDPPVPRASQQWDRQDGQPEGWEINHPVTPRGRSQQWDYRGQVSQDAGDNAVPGQYRRRRWTLGQEYEEEGGVQIPPIDYYDSTDTTGVTSPRILSLQEAILDRTLRLKKVPEELKRGLQK